MSLFSRWRNVAFRTLQAFVPSLASPDDELAARLLAPAELDLYRRMDVRDRAHATLVARHVLEQQPQAGRHVLVAALLHDVGKSLQAYRPLLRIIVHLYTPVGQPAGPLRPGLRGAWQLREHHEAIGAAMLRAAGGSERAAQLIEGLASDSGADPEVQLLRRADAST